MNVLAVDIGSTSVRGGLYDGQGRRQRAGASAPTGIRTAGDGTSEVDADELREKCWRVIDRVLQAAEARTADIAAVAVCTFAGNILGIDATGKAVTPLLTYADSRAQEDARQLAREVDETAVHRRTGCYLHASYLPARLRWMARTRPRLFSRVDRWVTIGEYLEMALFGETAVSTCLASWNGMLDRARLCWDEELLSRLPIDISQLSPLTDVSIPHRGLRPPFADRWPALSQVPWFPAMGDGAAAAVGSGCLDAGRVAITIGTSSAVRAVVTDAVKEPPDGLWCYVVDEKRSLVGGALNEGGSVFAWLRGLMAMPPDAEMERRLAAMAPDDHGLTLLPFLEGERSPGWAGGARGVIYGLSSATTSLEIMRAALEAVACRLYLVWSALRPHLANDHEIIASGGAVQASPLWLQILADALGRPVHLYREREVSSRGAALLAAAALGRPLRPQCLSCLPVRSVRPDLRRHARYRRAVERQQALYRALIKDRQPVVAQD